MATIRTYRELFELLKSSSETDLDQLIVINVYEDIYITELLIDFNDNYCLATQTELDIDDKSIRIESSENDGEIFGISMKNYLNSLDI